MNSKRLPPPPLRPPLPLLAPLQTRKFLFLPKLSYSGGARTDSIDVVFAVHRGVGLGLVEGVDVHWFSEAAVDELFEGAAFGPLH